VERRSFLKKAGVGLAAGAVAAPAIAQNAPTIKWRMASSFPKSLDTLHGSAEVPGQAHCRDVRRQVPDSALCRRRNRSGAGVHDAVKDNTVEIGFTCSYYYFGKDPTYCIDTAIPFGMNARQIKAWYRQGNGAKLMGEFFAKSNIIIVPVAAIPDVQMGGWYRKEIKTRCRSQGAEDACCRPGRRRALQARRGSATDRRAAISIRRWKRERSMPSSGSGLTTTRSWVSTR
jgi:TRAP-type mannitol/chloroaromatic compound transport system substrate-binding protein